MPRDVELTPPASSPVVSNRMQLPLQNSFGESEFTFQSPMTMDMSGNRSTFGIRNDAEVTYEVIDNGNTGREGGGGGGRKRGVSHQLGSIWDVGGLGNKRSRHM